ncbi:hypothetical protein SFC42_19305 [Priestia filamentosa]|uniref:hypothetical protein n=1 Tax=Priestia filamentosa TaxID=1402861 RepID=UPI00398390DA
METRTYTQLYTIIEQFYNQQNPDTLRNYLYANAGNYSAVVPNPLTPYPSLSIPYNQGSPAEHVINIRIPGLYTFGRKLEYSNIHKWDFAVVYSTPATSHRIKLTHLDIAYDLYQKVQTNGNQYSDIANILRNLYYDRFPLQGTNFNHINIHNQYFQGLSIPALVSNIKWIALQEDINHPHPSWGKKLAFCRYFEAIDAALNNLPFEKVSERIDNRSKQRPPLWPNHVYHIQI